MNNNFDKKITIDKVGRFLYYTYRLLKLFIFILNLYVIYKYFNDEPKFLILCLILNFIYFLIYINRIWLLLPSIIIFFYLYHNIFESIVLGIAIGNSISFVIDFIIVFFLNILFNIFDKKTKK